MCTHNEQPYDSVSSRLASSVTSSIRCVPHPSNDVIETLHALVNACHMNLMDCLHRCAHICGAGMGPGVPWEYIPQAISHRQANI